MLDRLTHDLATALDGLEADRARMAAILSGMIEGVLVVNAHGRLQLANEAGAPDAAASTTRSRAGTIRRSCASRRSRAQIAAALAGRPTESVELTGPARRPPPR